jgi:hypothetical protein
MPTTPFTLAEANLVALCTESICYGGLLATFGESLRALLAGNSSFRGNHRIRGVLLAVSCTMFVVATLHLIINIDHNIYAFVRDGSAGDAEAALRDLTSWRNISRVSSLHEHSHRGAHRHLGSSHNSPGDAW